MTGVIAWKMVWINIYGARWEFKILTRVHSTHTWNWSNKLGSFPVTMFTNKQKLWPIPKLSLTQLGPYPTQNGTFWVVLLKYTSSTFLLNQFKEIRIVLNSRVLKWANIVNLLGNKHQNQEYGEQKNLGKFNIKTIKVLIKGPWIYKRDTWKWYLLFCTWKVCDQQWKYTFIYNCFKLANKPIFVIHQVSADGNTASLVNNDKLWRSFKRIRVKMVRNGFSSILNYFVSCVQKCLFTEFSGHFYP